MKAVRSLDFLSLTIGITRTVSNGDSFELQGSILLTTFADFRCCLYDSLVLESTVQLNTRAVDMFQVTRFVILLLARRHWL